MHDERTIFRLIFWCFGCGERTERSAAAWWAPWYPSRVCSRCLWGLRAFYVPECNMYGRS